MTCDSACDIHITCREPGYVLATTMFQADKLQGERCARGVERDAQIATPINSLYHDYTMIGGKLQLSSGKPDGVEFDIEAM